MIRGLRSAKVAEYLATYSVLESIGIHDTTLIEHRDPAVQLGVFVRDACDTGTTLLVVPSKRVCALSVLEKIGVPLSLETGPSLTALDDGLVTFLTGASSASEWVSWCWRVAMERHRSHSHLWGWLQSVPSPIDYKGSADHASRLCRVHHMPLLPFYTKGHATIQRETTEAFEALHHNNVMPGRATFAWAVSTLLSRGARVPCCWPSATPHPVDADVCATELGVVPYVDLVNGPDTEGRVANATLEMATSVDELPDWYKGSVLVEATRKGRDGMGDLAQLVGDGRYCLCLALTAPLSASSEVIVEYPLTPLTTGVLSAEQDARLTRLLQFGY